MSERDCPSELSRLSNKKQHLEHQRDLTYKEINNLYYSLKEQFEILYPYFNEFDCFHFDISNVDFYFGEIACEYRGENYSLSNRLFEFNENLLNVGVFDLTLSQLVNIYNLLVILYHDFGNHEFAVIKKDLYDNFTVNDIIDKIKEQTECFTKRIENKQEGMSKELVSAIQKLYVLIDFALYEDETHNDLRRLHNLYIEVETASYDKISKYNESLGKIDERLDALKTQIETLEKVQVEQEQAVQEPATASKEPVQKSMVKKEEPKKVKRTLAAIPLSILGAWEVHLIYGLTNLIITLVFWLISYIPILNTLVEWLFRIREDTPDMFATFLAIGIAYIGFMATAHRIIKKVETRKLTLILTGIYLAISNFLFVIINLRYNDPILVNSLLTITGIVIFFKGKNT